MGACGCAIGAAAGPDQTPPAEPGHAIAQPDAPERAPLWRDQADDMELLPAGHPPFDQIPPMPMPEPGDGVPGGGPGVPITYDAETGRITEYPLYEPSGEVGGEGAGYVAPFGEWLDERWAPAGFGSMSEINAVGSDPWRRNAKAVIRFVDESGSDRFFVCSATMADAETVLIAGHCIYAHDVTGPDINDWAREIWVYPGWDGVGNQFSPPDGIIETYGYARGTFFGAFTGWTVDENFDWDMGLARVDRAAGMLTGWFGWAWGFGCGTIQGRTYHNAAYPSEGCGAPGLHNGRDMYYWFGGIDSCPGNQMQINTTPGCFTALWGGMSGSGVYYFNDNDDRLVHGVASNSNRTTIGRYAKMWESFKDFMIDFENDSRGSALDLQMLQARYQGSAVTAGQSIAGDRYVVTNPTNNNPGTATYSVTHYLSTNSNISTADTALLSESFSFNYAPMQSTTVNNTGINYTIPINTPSGDYFMGAILDTSDANNNNNDGDLWDAHAVTVNGVADLVAQSVSPNGSQGFLGETIGVDFSFRNQGGDPSNTASVEVRLSTNSTITQSDPLLGTFTYAGLSGGQTVSDSRTVTVPTNVGTGARFIGIIVDSSDDVDSSNNAAASRSTVQIDGRADLVADFIDAGAGPVPPGGNLPVRFAVGNEGLGSSGAYTVEVRASLNDFISDGDPLLRTFNMSSLSPGATTGTVNTTVTIPNDLAPDSYFIGMIVEPGAFENDTSDNTAVDDERVTVQPDDCPADLTGPGGDGVPDGNLTADDFFFYLGLFADADPQADLTGPGGDGVPDGSLTADDFFFYLGLFSAGCP